jgi:uncharacterized membrane protein YphA (DoxX/SURF4 family)
MRTRVERLVARIFEPQPIVRLEVVRILAPLAILGFMAARIAHPDDWLSTDGFRVPALAGDWRQPVSLPGIAPWAAWSVCAALVASGLMVSIGAFTRWSAAVFAGALAYVTLADRMSAFTVSKLGTVVAIVLCLSPSGTRYSIDAWRRRRREPSWRPPELCSGGPVRFFQILLPVFYMASGICKLHGDWLAERFVLWSHLHGSYQTAVSWFAANHLPPVAWTVMQGTTLFFECMAPLLFALRWTRPFALAYGIAMHALIGMMFGPVVYFAMLMIVLLVAAYIPVHWLAPRFGLQRSTRARRPPTGARRAGGR